MILNGATVRCISATIRPVNDEFILSSNEIDSILLLNATSYEIYQILSNETEEALDNTTIAKKMARKFDISVDDIHEVESDVTDIVNTFFENGVLTLIQENEDV